MTCYHSHWRDDAEEFLARLAFFLLGATAGGLVGGIVAGLLLGARP